MSPRTASPTPSRPRAAVTPLTEPAAEAAIAAACRILGLPTIRDEAARIADAAARERLSHKAFLAEVLTAECDDRDARRRIRRVHEAKFPRTKRLADFDPTALPDLPPATLAHLAAGAWIDAGEPLVLLGDSGTGKTHLLIALGTAAAEQGRRVRYVTTAALVNELAEAADDKQLSRVVARYARLDLLVPGRGRLRQPRPPRRRTAVPDHHRPRGARLHRLRLQRPVQRMGHHLHRPPPRRRRRRPAHLQRPHHQHRHQLLPAALNPSHQEGSRHCLTVPATTTSARPPNSQHDKKVKTQDGAKTSRHSGAKTTCHSHWAVGYNTIALPVAAGVFAGWGLTLRPEIAALSMSGSSLIVAVNALLLKRLRLPAPIPNASAGASPAGRQDNPSGSPPSDPARPTAL